MFALLILLSQNQDPRRNKSYTLIKMCECVDIFGGWWMKLLVMNHLSLFSFSFKTWAIFSSFSPFFLTCPESMWHTFFGYASFISTCLERIWHTFFGYASFLFSLFFLQHAFLSLFLISFCKAHISDDGFGERCHVYFVWMTCFARLPMWKPACICGVYVILIKVLTRVKEFDKTQSKVKQHLQGLNMNIKLWLW